MFTPFIRELRCNYPESKLTLLVRPAVAQLAETCPYIDEVLILRPRPEIKDCPSYTNYSLALVQYLNYVTKFAGEHLRGRFDMAIHPLYGTDLDGGTLITYLSRASRTIGYSEQLSADKRWANFGQDRLLTDVLPPSPPKHERSLDIIRYLGGSVQSDVPEIWLTAEDRARGDAFAAGHGIAKDRPIIAFGIGASDMRRQWPDYSELIRLLASELDFVPLLLAGPREEHIARAIQSECISAIAMQSLPLRVVAAVLSRCTAFIGNDSGPMHLAAAAGLPVVEISCHPVGGRLGHGNDPGRYGPLANRKVVIQPKDFRDDCYDGCNRYTPHCIAAITAQEVASKVIALLQERSPVSVS